MSNFNQEIQEQIQSQAKSIINRYGTGSLYHKPNKKPQFSFFYDDETGTKKRKTVSISDGADPQQVKLQFIEQILTQRYLLQQEQKKRQLLQETISNDFLLKVDRIVEALPETKKTLNTCTKTVSQVLDEYIEDCKTRNLAYITYSTHQQRARKIKEIIGNTKITEITTNEFQKMLYNIRTDENEFPSENYLRSIKYVMIGTLKYAKRCGYIKSYFDIIEDVKLPSNLTKLNPDDKFLEYSELAKVLYAVRNNKRYFTFITLLTLTGLRSQELYGLRKKDIQYDNHRLHIVQAIIKNEKKNEFDKSVTIGNPKNKSSSRYVPATDSVCNILSNWVSHREKKLAEKAIISGNEDIVFVSQDGTLTDRNVVNKAFKQYINDVVKREQLKDIPHFSFHMCRHCFATYLHREGCDLETIQQCMGHTTRKGSVTQIHYIAPSNDYIEKALPYLKNVEKKLIEACKVVENQYKKG